MNKIFILLWLIFINCESIAETSYWIDVENVASDDTLSVRSEPHTKSDKIGALSFDEKFIRVLSDKKLEKSTWLNIQYKNKTGWINRYYTKKSQIKLFKDNLRCLGTEPFWSLDIIDGHVVSRDLSENEKHFAVTRVSLSSNHNNRWFLKLNDGVTFENENEERSLFLTENQSCNDGMSDKTYRYDIGFEFSDESFHSGCCNVVPN